MTVRCTEEERDTLELAAAGAGVPVARFVREAALAAVREQAEGYAPEPTPIRPGVIAGGAHSAVALGSVQFTWSGQAVTAAFVAPAEGHR